MSAALKERPKVLCVDDEPLVLDGLARQLGRRFQVVTAGSGAKALEVLSGQGPFAVVLSDMRMPAMSGAEFLQRALSLAPTTPRLLLTGQSDLNDAARAVNEGQISRFLLKPCPPEQLLGAVEHAAEQHRLLETERVLLEQTLKGSVEALCDVLAFAEPLAFGRATRIQRLAMSLADKLSATPRWPLEVAAMFSQLGALTLPRQTFERWAAGQALSAEEAAQVEKVPELNDKLLGHIPRLEGVRYVLRHARARPAGEPVDRDEAHHRRLAQILGVAQRYEALATAGQRPQVALAELGKELGARDKMVLDALREVLGETTKKDVVQLPVRALRRGMVVAEDVLLTTGALLVPRGYAVTDAFVARVKNMAEGSVREPLWVELPE